MPRGRKKKVVNKEKETVKVSVKDELDSAIRLDTPLGTVQFQGIRKLKTKQKFSGRPV